GGSGAIAVLLTDGSFGQKDAHRLVGAATKNASEHHALCRWGVNLSPTAMSKMVLSPQKLREAVSAMMKPETIPGIVRELMSSTADHLPATIANLIPHERVPKMLEQFMSTDSVGVLKHGVDLGLRTWEQFLTTMGWARDQIDKVICHQVGSMHQQTVLRTLGIDADKDFATYAYLGNIGTVSLPITAAIAKQRGHLRSGDRVSFLGIGSGLNCLMLGWDW
ncbi:MAG: 3-oxoacyl-[acyl-carrier-protein] synthase III C-terminal domain-containing protein, partial [Planctomycetota bacterium]